jgi:hypothetical protein
VDLYIYSPIRLHGVVLNYLSTRTTLAFILEEVWRVSLISKCLSLILSVYPFDALKSDSFPQLHSFCKVSGGLR